MWTAILKRILVAYYLVRGVPMRWKPFELAVLNSLFRIEARQRVILDGITELLNEGPNDQALKAKIAEQAKLLDDAVGPLKAAIEENS